MKVLAPVSFLWAVLYQAYVIVLYLVLVNMLQSMSKKILQAFNCIYISVWN
jgi:hypothetical protein